MSSLDGRDSLAELHQIDVICDQFERSWNAGAGPRIEDFVVELPKRSRPLLLKHLILTEIALRQRASDPPLIADYLQRFPNNRDVVESLWSSPSVANIVTVSGSVESTEESLQAGAVVLQNVAAEPMPSALGRFQILHQIDCGSFGTIYLAFDPTFSRQVAIKLPRTNVLNTPRLRTRIIREAQALGQINDPRVCPVYEIGDPEGQCYLVMPYLSGESLDAYRKRRERLDPRTAAEIVREVALALQHVHQAGIVHRDLTPRNIQITADRTPVILDFGLARPLVTRDATVTGSGEVLGTPAYMAPEQAVGDSARIGPAVDIYSLGVILF